MPSPFTTLVSIETFMSKVSEIVVADVAKQAHDKLIENIIANLQSSNANYFNKNGRTGQFQESFVLGSVMREFNLIFQEINYDTSKMQLGTADVQSSWDSHMSQDKKEDIREELAAMLNVTGVTSSTSAKSTGMFEGKREPYWDETLKWIESNYRKLFKQAYAKNGVTIQ